MTRPSREPSSVRRIDSVGMSHRILDESRRWTDRCRARRDSIPCTGHRLPHLSSGDIPEHWRTTVSCSSTSSPSSAATRSKGSASRSRTGAWSSRGWWGRWCSHPGSPSSPPRTLARAGSPATQPNGVRAVLPTAHRPRRGCQLMPDTGRSWYSASRRLYRGEVRGSRNAPREPRPPHPRSANN